MDDKKFTNIHKVIAIIIIILLGWFMILAVNKSKNNNTQGNIIEVHRTDTTSNYVDTTEEDKELSIEEINNKYDAGTDSTTMMLNQYGKVSTDDTVLNDSISINKIDEISDDIYNKLMLEASAIAESKGYKSIEMRLDEYNVNTGYISYIAKFDDSIYYYVMYDTNTDILASSEDIYNCASDTFNGIKAELPEYNAADESEEWEENLLDNEPSMREGD